MFSSVSFHTLPSTYTGNDGINTGAGAGTIIGGDGSDNIATGMCTFTCFFAADGSMLCHNTCVDEPGKGVITWRLH